MTLLMRRLRDRRASLPVSALATLRSSEARPGLWGWLTWVTAAMWMAWLSRLFPFHDNRYTVRDPDDASIGPLPLYVAKRSRLLNREHVADLGPDGGSHVGAYPEELGSGGARRLDGSGDVPVGLADLVVGFH